MKTKLRIAIDNSGYKMTYLAKRLGVGKSTLSQKVNCTTRCRLKADEAIVLSDLLNIPVEELFDEFHIKEEKNGKICAD